MADFPAGGSVSAATLVDRTKDVVSGQRRSTTATATSGTTELVWATAPAVNLRASTTYRVEVNCYFENSVNGDQFAFRIRSTNVSGTIRNGVVEQGLGGGPYSVQVTAIYETTTAESGVVFCATVVRLTGGGTATVKDNSDLLVCRLADSGLITSV